MMFRQLEIDDEIQFNEMIDKNPVLYSDFYGSEICFDVLWQWRGPERMVITKGEHSLVVSGFDPELPEGERARLSHIFPFADSPAAFLESVRRIVAEVGGKTLLTCLSDRMKQMLEKEFPEAIFDPWPELFEYLYETGDLAAFPGKKYHAKRNFVRSFEAHYDYQIRPYSPELREDVQRMLKVWAEDKGESLSDENEAIRAALDKRERLKIELLYVDGKIEGFIIGERVRDFAIIMYFKCNTEYKGIYPFMLSNFVRRNFSECRFVSMQEDMGIEGLRKSKESYHPAFLQQKYVMRFE